tara:strand:- start:910 stop:1536 length:627 start_codon:yes stop_codon:yes gene_type:complete
MKIDSISINGKTTEHEISEKIISSNISNKLIAHVLYSQIANSKKRIAKTKQRSEITGSTAKIYAQKGTGNARHSSRKAPIFVGGGVAHGPKGNVYKTRKINKKEKRNSLAAAVSQKIKEKNLILFDDIKNKINKTKDFSKFLKKNSIQNVLIVADESTKKNIEISTRNIPNLKLIHVSHLKAYDILLYKKIMFSKTSIKEFENIILKK